MKIDIVRICSYLILLVAIVEAQRYSKLNKPIIDLNSRPQVTTTFRPPEERRKLSIFPKNMAKYVITSKPYAKVRSYSPWELSTKRPLMLKMIPYNAKTSKVVPTTKPSVTKFTRQPLKDQIPKEQFHERAYLSNKDNSKDANKQTLVFPSNNGGNPRLSKINNQFVSRDIELEAENTDQILVVTPTVIEEKTNKVTSTESSNVDTAANIELDPENNRPKRLTFRGFGEYNNINVPNKSDVYVVERKDYDEFIFVNEKFKPVEKKEKPNELEIEDEQEITTDVTWLEEAPESRPVRSVNIIEEENLGTTISGYKFTGQEPRVNSHLLFKNINA